MKRPFILFSLFLNILLVNAQSGIFSVGLQSNVVYFGIINSLSAFASNVPCNQIELKVNQGKITKIGECQYNYQADSIGTAIISIYKTIGHKKIKMGENYFSVKKLPRPTAFVGNYYHNEDTVYKNEFMVQKGIFTNISADYYSGANELLNPLEYTIKE